MCYHFIADFGKISFVEVSHRKEFFLFWTWSDKTCKDSICKLIVIVIISCIIKNTQKCPQENDNFVIYLCTCCCSIRCVIWRDWWCTSNFHLFFLERYKRAYFFVKLIKFWTTISIEISHLDIIKRIQNKLACLSFSFFFLMTSKILVYLDSAHSGMQERIKGSDNIVEHFFKIIFYRFGIFLKTNLIFFDD